jgi:hypothetical protein
MVWWAVHYKKRKEKEEKEREERRELTPQERLKIEAETQIEDTYQTLVRMADDALEYLRRKKKEVDDPGIKAMIEDLEEHWRVLRPKDKVHPGAAIAALALQDALRKGLHQTPEGKEKIYQYMIKRAYQIAKQMAGTVKPHHNMKHVKETITNPMEVLDQVDWVIYYAEGKDEKARKYHDALSHVLGKSYKELKEEGLDLHTTEGKRILGHLHHERVEEKIDKWFRKLEEEGKIPRFWDLTPEQILEGKAPPPPNTMRAEIPPANTTLGRLLETLEGLGIIEIEPTETGGVIKLTETGECIAKCLANKKYMRDSLV